MARATLNSALMFLFSSANASNLRLFSTKRAACFQSFHGLTHLTTITTTLSSQLPLPFSLFPGTKSPLHRSESTQQKNSMNMNIENRRSDENFGGPTDDIPSQSKWEKMQHVRSASPKNGHIQFQPKWRKKVNRASSTEENRPIPKKSIARGFNSYIKVTMDDAIFQDLHGLISQISDCWRDVLKSEQEAFDGMESQLNANESRTESIKQKPRDHHQMGQQRTSYELVIKQRSLRSLHMTFFFCGTVLDQMTYEQLSLWNTSIRQLIQNKGFLNSKCTLKFQSLAVFPPHRENLIVALFRASSNLDELYQELCNLAVKKKEICNSNQGACAVDTCGHHDLYDAEYEFPHLRGLIESKKDFQQTKRNRVRCNHMLSSDDGFTPWIAHVTLGNLTGASKEEVKTLKQWLKDIDTVDVNAGGRISTSQLKIPRALQSEIRVRGLSLGGPLPRNVELDWDFPLHKNAH